MARGGNRDTSVHTPIKVLLADDHTMFREGLAAISRILYRVGPSIHADTCVHAVCVEHFHVAHHTPQSPSGMAPSESLRTSTWGLKPSNCPSRTFSGTSITSESGRRRWTLKAMASRYILGSTVTSTRIM